MGKITAVILDWAGTAVDYGSFAPVDAFARAFAAFGVEPTLAEIRAPMGLEKRAHIARMLAEKRLAAQWYERHGRPCAQRDVDQIYAEFEAALFEALQNFAEPLPGVLETVDWLRARRIQIGSTTGYTRGMMDVVVPQAKERGYAPDCVVCPEDVGAGRPAPYMLWRNLERLGVASIREALKVGDTAADMQEAKNAGCRCVGVLKGSNMLGLSMEEFRVLGADGRQALFGEAKRKYLDAGADYVIEEIARLPELIERIYSRST
jgi:phosphonoacetaldehyde hydrolase